MSKQSEAKESQGYRPASARQCANCKAFSSTTEKVPRWNGDPTGWIKEANKRCTLGGFAVTKTAICDCWAPVP